MCALPRLWGTVRVDPHRGENHNRVLAMQSNTKWSRGWWWWLTRETLRWILVIIFLLFIWGVGSYYNGWQLDERAYDDPRGTSQER